METNIQNSVTANNKICRLCFESVLEDNVQHINDIQKELLDVLLIVLDLDVSELPSICNSCCDELQRNFDFKSQCIETEDFLTPYLVSGNAVNFDEIIANNVIKLENGQSQNICRLCLNATTKAFKIDDVEIETFKKFLPEIKLVFSMKCNVCSNCHESLQNYFTFAIKCLNWEHKLKLYQKKVILRRKRKICLEHFRENIEKVMQFENEEENTCVLKDNFSLQYGDSEINIKHELEEVEAAEVDNDGIPDEVEVPENEEEILNTEDQSQVPEDVFKCSKCSYASKYKYYFKKHELMHEGIRKVYEKKIEKKYKCRICTYTSKSITYIKKHELMHDTNAKEYKCNFCPLKTKYKECLFKHIRVVHNSNAEVFRCNDCDFTTKHKISIARHVVTHKKTKILKCKLCDYSTEIPKNLELHECTKKKKYKRRTKMFYCEICPYKINSSSAMNEHRRIIHCIGEQIIFKCEICSFFTQRKSTLQKHTRAHKKNNKTVYKCPYCEFNTFETHCLRKHISSIHQDDEDLDKDQCVVVKGKAEKKFKCTECDAAFVREVTLQRHYFVHSEEKPFKCSLCSYRGKSQKNLDSHKDIHKETILTCEVCGFKTKTRARLKLHMTKHQTSAKIYKCKLCPFKSIWQSSYKTHLVASHLRKMFTCDICDFQTPHRRTIISHRHIHEKHNMPTLQCYDCNFTTKRKDCLKAHMLIHKTSDEVKMFKCVKCSFESKYKRSLRNHIRDIHELVDPTKTHKHNNNDNSSGDGKYQCEKCAFVTASINYLNRHIKGQHEAKHELFKCDQCPYTTKIKYNLNGHFKRMHENDQVFICAHCEFQTKYAKSLKNHISNKHEQWEVLDKQGHKEIKRKDDNVDG